VFTGERMTSASARHITGEEACVALLALEPLDDTTELLAICHIRSRDVTTAQSETAGSA
jgi:hypothetical protein